MAPKFFFHSTARLPKPAQNWFFILQICPKTHLSPYLWQKWKIFIYFFSVTTARQKPYTGVVGTQLIVQLNASRNIGTGSIKKCAEENDDYILFLSSFFVLKNKGNISIIFQMSIIMSFGLCIFQLIDTLVVETQYIYFLFSIWLKESMFFLQMAYLVILDYTVSRFRFWFVED